MTYKCKHCGTEAFQAHSGRWYHVTPKLGVTCGQAEPDGPMPDPPDPQREKLIALARTWRTLAKESMSPMVYKDCARELLAELGIPEEETKS